MSYLIRRVLAKPHLILDEMCRLYRKFASYLRCVLCKTRLIFPRINGPIVCDSDWMFFFFSCVKNIVCSSDLGGGGKNQLAYESVWRSLSQYIYNKQLWKIFTRTYRQNDNQYPSMLFYTKWITWISGMTLQHFFYSHHYGVKAKISCMSQCPLISPQYQFSVHRHKKWSVCSGVMDSW